MCILIYFACKQQKENNGYCIKAVVDPLGFTQDFYNFI